MARSETTLFMFMSVDGKISTGSTDERGEDRDFPNIPGVGEGLPQYYALEQSTDPWNFSSGRVLAKIGANERKPFQNDVANSTGNTKRPNRVVATMRQTQASTG